MGEKSWKMWHHIGSHHIDDAEWFLKIDDDTFFSPINFRGFARYFNPESKWYFGTTLMHLWEAKNVVFNAGSCYAISRGALKKLVGIFESDSFLTTKKGHGSGATFCRKRRGDKEDASMGVCLHSVGIDPINTLDAQYRERFSLYREDYQRRHLHRGMNLWYFAWRIDELGMKEQCCAEHMITFHGYKHDRVEAYR